MSGNILTLVPSELTLNSGSPVSEFDLTWIWMGSYLKASTPIAGLAITTQKVIEISTTGSLIELVNPNVVIASAHLTTEKTKEINSQGLTYVGVEDPSLQHCPTLSGSHEWVIPLLLSGWFHSTRLRGSNSAVVVFQGIGHHKYACPGKLSGLPLPGDATAATLLDSHEEETFGVPIHPTFNNIAEKSTDSMSTCKKHRHTNANAFAAGAAGGKHACHSK
ncbi:hypothetical protein EDD16DRAFT_1709288 [Pisolithus croceorrhizus]|nr:hypothetical protein EDD16DRAFT_1709288 [Pisolithus croceorrhizus]